MMKLLTLALVFASAPLLASFGPESYQGPEQDLIINNRVLAAPVGKTITMMDVIRRLDMVFYRQYPELTSSAEARYQFYMMGWRQAFDDMINADLMVADAESKQVSVSDGDIREEMERQFGPNVVETIDELGLTYDEAWEVMKTELIVQRMNGFMVTGRAIAAVSPDRIRQAYREYVEAQGSTQVWHYRVLSISHRDSAESQKAAEVAQGLLCRDEFGSLESVRDHLIELREEGELPAAISVKLTDRFSRKEQEMAKAHRTVVCDLSEGCCSDAIAQVSRVDGSTVYRIFSLEEVEDPGLPSFNEMEHELRMKLLSQEAGEAEKEYVARLRKRYNINDEELGRSIPSDLKPVALR